MRSISAEEDLLFLQPETRSLLSIYYRLSSQGVENLVNKRGPSINNTIIQPINIKNR